MHCQTYQLMGIGPDEVQDWQHLCYLLHTPTAAVELLWLWSV